MDQVIDLYTPVSKQFGIFKIDKDSVIIFEKVDTLSLYAKYVPSACDRVTTMESKQRSSSVRFISPTCVLITAKSKQDGPYKHGRHNY